MNLTLVTKQKPVEMCSCDDGVEVCCHWPQYFYGTLAACAICTRLRHCRSFVKKSSRVNRQGCLKRHAWGNSSLFGTIVCHEIQKGLYSACLPTRWIRRIWCSERWLEWGSWDGLDSTPWLVERLRGAEYEVRFRVLPLFMRFSGGACYFFNFPVRSRNRVRAYDDISPKFPRVVRQGCPFSPSELACGRFWAY